MLNFEWTDDSNWRFHVSKKMNVCLMTERDTSLQMSHFAQAIGQKMKFMIDQKRLPWMVYPIMAVAVQRMM
jgi:hypothetical protein